jgi:serine/threonine protein kinase
MATVYLGRISGAGGFQRFVGIKRLHPHLARDAEFVQMFLDEARLAARIHHPNVVPILEIGTSEQGYYIVMEYIEGDTLAQLIARAALGGGRLPVHIATRIVVDVLTGLHAAHEMADDDGKPLGIVHRDVSPQNILIGVDGSARLTDFGVARATSQLSTTRTGQLKGKLAYMAPEQARATKDIDRRADIFAAGVVLWEALEGRRLFRGDGEVDTLHKVLNEPIPALRDAVPAAPPELETVLEGALDRDRTRRFATAAQFADALERVAIESGDVATHRDVAAYLDATLGAGILEHREAVRAWLARIEPAKPKSLSMPPPAPLTVPPLSRLGARSISPERPISPERTPPSGASVASSVISTNVFPRSISSRPPPPPEPPHARVWPWALVVAIAAAGGVGFLMRRTGAHAMADAPPPPIAPEATSSIVLPIPTPTVEPSGTPEAVGPDSAASVAATTPPAIGPHPSRTGVPRPAPSLVPTSAPVPDDISRNPYR